MESKKLGHVIYCNLRDIWKQEADFSDWLFEEGNMELLSETLGLESIIPQIREVNVGDFKADIFAEDSDSGHGIVIENQLETSDHMHLGKLITYAAGKDASIIIWIVKDARPEHESAIEWLNNNITNKQFFLVQIEVIQIEGSVPAPVFNIIVKPNSVA